jgi:SPP1 gp7 family putative phage head morphogenesis protein
MSEVELRDAILRHSLQLQRLSAGDAAKADAILRELERELKLLLQSQNLSAATKADIAALIREAEKAITPAYGKLAGTVDTQALAIVVAEKTAEVLEDAFPANILAPTPERLASLTRDVLIEGSPLSQWWEAQRENLKRNFAAQVRQGVIAGETNERIVRRVAGGRAETGIMDIARRHARTLVHSSIMSAANEARLATYRKNGRFIAGMRWLATLDSHTCKRCAALDGQAWDLDGQPMKGTETSFILPPAHAACRCVASPVVKGFEGSRGGTRASSEGPIAATTTFEDFLKRQSPAFIARTLGRKRAEMFRAGKLTLRDLISGSGRELTLEELQAHI